MHPWGKWGRNFVEYGVAAAQDALRDAGLAWSDVQFVSGADTVRNGYPGYVAGATFAQALGWTGARVASSYAACASGVTALEAARTRILAGLCDVALVVGADTTPKGFLAPNGGDRPDDPDWLRFRLLGATNPTYFALYARRRMDLHGATDEDFAQVKVKNARHGLANPNARYRKEVTVEEVARLADGGRPAAPARDLRHLRRRRGDRAGQHGLRPAPHHRPGAGGGRLDGHADLSRTPSSTCRTSPPTPAAVAAPPERPFKASIAHAAYEEAGVGPEDLSLAEVYDLSSALELDWYEDIGLCKPGEAERLLHDGDTTLGGRIPVNPSGGLGLLRRGRAGAGDRAGVRGRLAAAGPGRRPPGRGGPHGDHRQPGPVRPRLLGAAHPLSRPGIGRRPRSLG